MRQDKYHIIFVCTDNFGRSVIAEYCLIDYCERHNIHNLDISSAGTNANSDTSKFSLAHYDELKNIGIDASKHIRRQLDGDLIEKNDLLVPMDVYHQNFIKRQFQTSAPLFNEISKNKHSSIRVHNNSKKFILDDRMRFIVHYIYKAMPEFYKNLDKYL